MSWNAAPGDEIVPGRFVTSRLGLALRYETFLVWNERLLSPTVLKLLRPDRLEDAAARAAMASEADALARLEHPSFIRIFGRDTDGARPYLELEYLMGPRLSTLVRRHGVLVPEQLFPLARQLSSALGYLHDEGFVHLDVKPRNIIMGPVPRLIDLSVARRISELGRIRRPIGTAGYMAPEQSDPARFGEIGPASDVWGLGATLYEAVSKQRPFDASNGADANGHGPGRREPFPLPAKVPASIAEPILASLSDRPEARPAPRQLFALFDDLADRHGVAKLRFK
ncbi:MAG TPA: serine/threonine-protein kinase [Candidatus Limnocylindria bacterium]|nr:serine/threonine-protein kinase [Candidatus Limnocylindria bacterium]